jgi:hypothetical protein
MAVVTADCHMGSDDIECANLVQYYVVLYPRWQHSTAVSDYHFITHIDRRQLFPTSGSQTPGGCRAITSSLLLFQQS